MKQTQSPSPKGGRSEPNWLWNLKEKKKKKSLEFISNQVMKTWLTAEINRIHSLQHDIHSMRNTIQNCSKYNKIRKMRSLNEQSEWGRSRQGKLWYSTLVSLPIRSGSMRHRKSHSILNFHSLHTFQCQEPFYFSKLCIQWGDNKDNMVIIRNDFFNHCMPWAARRPTP